MKNFVFIATVFFILGVFLGIYVKVYMLCIFFIIVNIVLYIINKNILKVDSFINIINNYIYNFNIKIIPIITLICFIGACYSGYINNVFEHKYDNLSDVNLKCTIMELEDENEYNMTYKVKVNEINNDLKFKNTYVLIKINKKNNINYGDFVLFTGKILKPDIRRNYKGFNYQRYLNSKKIYTVVNVNTTKIIKKNNRLNIYSIKAHLINNVKKINKEDTVGIILALTLGYKVGISDKINNIFKESSLLHILAISGMHVSYIVLMLNMILKKINVKISVIIQIFILIFYIFYRVAYLL